MRRFFKESPVAAYRFFQYRNGQGPIPDSFEIFRYPMGDVTVRVDPAAEDLPYPRGARHLLVVNGASVDWTIVAAWAELAHRYPGDTAVLILPYLPSARGDKDIPGPARINARAAAATGIDALVTVDPHSPVWYEEFHRSSRAAFVTADLGEMVSAAIGGPVGDDGHRRYAGVIAPDAGARARAHLTAAALELPVLAASKRRDPETGRITGYGFDHTLAPEPWLVVDDICDGGATFGILRDCLPKNSAVDLWVTHGGFTGGNRTRKALSRYRQIYTTNSLPTASAFALTSTKTRVYDAGKFLTETAERITS